MAQPLPRAYRLQLMAKDKAKVARIVAEVDALETPTTAAGGTAAGDQRRLRGIPAAGRGCAGHISGTRPDTALLAPERRTGS